MNKQPSIVLSFLPKDSNSAHRKVTPSTTSESVEETIAPYNTTPLVDSLRKGFKMLEFQKLQELLRIPEEELGRYLGISPATLHRRKKSGHLETPESERIVQFARLFWLCMEVFGTAEASREWLKTPNPGTATESPLSYSDTEFGAREVENLLGRIDEGVFC
jgi:putative toxin-antitoxin system antitoxin component (TIGR02293 family)